MGWILWIPAIGAGLVAYIVIGVAVQWWEDWWEGINHLQPVFEPSTVVLWPLAVCILVPVTIWRVAEPWLKEIHDVFRGTPPSSSPTTDGEGTGCEA